MDATFYAFNSERYNGVQKSAFLKKNDIYNDIDFFQYVAQYKYKKNTLFTSVDEMKEKYAFNLFISVLANDRLKKFTIINGDYTGYIMEAGKVIEVNILRNNKRYTFLFAGDGLNDYEYVKDFLSTIEIR